MALSRYAVALTIAVAPQGTVVRAQGSYDPEARLAELKLTPTVEIEMVVEIDDGR